jgi:ectoine hydroxylase-related dioxygenase (phytanoyl-CoA dioxygenase family)
MGKAKPRVLLVELTEQAFMELATAVDKYEIECDDNLGRLDEDNQTDHKDIKLWSERKEKLNDGWVAIRNAWHKAGAV